MATELTCAQVNDYLARNDNMFGPWIHEALKESDPWYALTPKEAFPEGRGYTQKDILIEGITTGSDESDWDAVTASNGSTINPLSLPDFTDLSWGQTYTEWSPYAKNYRTPCIALDDLRFDNMAAKQLGATVEQLKGVTKEMWANRARYEYARLVPQITARPGFGSGIAGVTDTTKMVKVPAATSVVTQSILDAAYDQILSTGAGEDPLGPVNREDGAPVFTFITSRATSDNIIRASGIRDDFRYGDPGQLLKPLGVRRVYRGFAHVVDTELPRFNLVDNVWTRVMPWTMSATSSGYKRTRNASYATAEYELNYIHLRSAMSFAIINTQTARPVPEVSFTDRPEYYNAQVLWHNVQDNSSNTLGKIGRFLFLAAGATHPGTPFRAMTILSRRCSSDQTFTGCSCG